MSRSEDVTQAFFAVTRADMRRLREGVCADFGVSMTELVRWALNDWLEDQDLPVLDEVGPRGRPISGDVNQQHGSVGVDGDTRTAGSVGRQSLARPTILTSTLTAAKKSQSSQPGQNRHAANSVAVYAGSGAPRTVDGRSRDIGISL